jgi:hypothetical protein
MKERETKFSEKLENLMKVGSFVTESFDQNEENLHPLQRELDDNQLLRHRLLEEEGEISEDSESKTDDEKVKIWFEGSFECESDRVLIKDHLELDKVYIILLVILYAIFKSYPFIEDKI